MTDEISGIVRFGGFELDPTTGELWRDGEPVDLPPQPTRLLALLARTPGRIVSRERIQEEIWGDTVVEFDQAINNAIRQVRSALGDDASAPRFIETVPRRGYRFIAPVEPLPPGTGPDGNSSEETGSGGEEPGPGAAPDGRTDGWTPGRVAAFAVLAMAIVVGVWVGLRDGGSDQGTVVAVVPARATTVGTPAEAVADTLTSRLLTGLTAMEENGFRIVPWTWDMGLDAETGRAMRDGEVVDVDVLAEANVTQGPEGLEVSTFLTRLPSGTQVWYRRVEGLNGDPADIADRIVEVVLEAVRAQVAFATDR